MQIEKMMHEVTKTIQENANAKAVYAEAVKLEHHTVIPVARTSATMMIGGGALGEENDAKNSAGGDPFGSGAVGALRLTTQPVGFIHEQGDRVVFTTIDLPHESLLSDLSSLFTSPVLTKVFSLFTGVEIGELAKSTKKSLLGKKR